jgi:acyl carrier protein
MKNEQEIFSRIVQVLEDLFEVDPRKVTPEARLYEDLDIDSIDAVDLVVELKKITGKKMRPDDFKAVRSVQDVVDAVSRLINED